MTKNCMWGPKLFSLERTLNTETRTTKNKLNRREKKGRKMNSISIKCSETEYWLLSGSDFPLLTWNATETKIKI